jgi:hypothetical protein
VDMANVKKVENDEEAKERAFVEMMRILNLDD